MIHHTTRGQISRQWLRCPTFKIWPRPKHQGTLWFIAHMEFYVVKNFRSLSPLNYAPQAVAGLPVQYEAEDVLEIPRQLLSYE